MNIWYDSTIPEAFSVMNIPWLITYDCKATSLVSMAKVQQQFQEEKL